MIIKVLDLVQVVPGWEMLGLGLGFQVRVGTALPAGLGDMGRACELFLALRTLPLAAKHEGRFHFQCQKDLISTRCLSLPQEEGQQWPLLLLLPALVAEDDVFAGEVCEDD